MTLTLVREPSWDGKTFGMLYINGRWECHTLEDVVRAEKIAGQTAISAGTYAIDITFSPKFSRRLPLVQDVPGFSGVRIHPGNTARDTEGCLLVGAGRNVEGVVQSMLAFGELFRKLIRAIENDHERVTLVIRPASETFKVVA